jgi:hypothetical protein
MILFRVLSTFIGSLLAITGLGLIPLTVLSTGRRWPGFLSIGLALVCGISMIIWGLQG